MAWLNSPVTASGRGVYWHLIDIGGPDVLTIAVNGQTPQSLKNLVRTANVVWIGPPEDEYGEWMIDLDVMQEHANTEGTSSGFPSWVGGRVGARPSMSGGGVRFDITSGMLR
jgi:hypothetical protein